MALSPTLLPIPYLDLRWVHAGAQHLSLLPNPITTASTTYKAFSASESERIEERWVSMSEEERRTAMSEWGQGEGEGAPKKEKKEKERENLKDRQKEKEKETAPVEHPVDEGRANPKEKGEAVEVIRSGEEQKDPDLEGRYKDLVAQAQKEYENLELVRGVPVSQDSLFEVHLPSLSLHPVFWAHTGPRVSVLRGSWFVTDDSKPCSWDLAEEIEKAYQEIRPWQPSYKHELATAVSLGAAAEEKLKYALPARFGLGLGIIFEDGEKGRLETAGALSYISKTFWSSLRARPSGTYVYRGYAAARLASGKEKEREPRSCSVSRRGSMASLKKPEVEHPSGSRRGSAASARRPEMDAPPVVVEAARDKSILNTSAVDEENIPVVDDEEEDTPCTDLILVVHGIGQQLATQYEAYNFVYAGNQLRQVIRNQSKNPALASIVRDRRIQVLPVQWRASLQLDQHESEEDQEHGMDNRFTMADITINKSIPYVRELTNSVLLDIPLFMSQHRLKMIEAVCLQSNKLYRLWMARNPGWKGRIHLIGHSLGSALVAHILSNQPTKMPELSALPKQVILKTKDRFIFNTSNFFVAGSPLGIFLHLDQAQIMPRKGRERTMHSPQDEALDRAGKFGCMAIDSFYNVFYFSDPVAYQLNAAVDCELSKKRQPLAISSVGSSFSVNSISQYLPVALRKQLEGKPQRPGAIRLPSGLEMLGPNGKEKLQGSRGERRFSALNPHGSVDFYLPSSGPSEYLDMITSHASYWTDASFAAFLLAETFSTRLDLMRTGLGLALDPALTST